MQEGPQVKKCPIAILFLATYVIVMSVSNHSGSIKIDGKLATLWTCSSWIYKNSHLRVWMLKFFCHVNWKHREKWRVPKVDFPLLKIQLQQIVTKSLSLLTTQRCNIANPQTANDNIFPLHATDGHF